MDFPITVTGRQIDITEPLRDYATQKMSRACRYLDKITAVHVTLSVEKYRHITEVVVQAHGTTLRGREETESMYSSIDQVMSKIEAQAKRLKERIKSKKRPEGKEDAVPEEEGFPDPPRVIVAETFAAKPLTVDDAVRELQGRNGLFLVFHNTQSGQVNVVYKRSDGHFGLVQPHS